MTRRKLLLLTLITLVGGLLGSEIIYSRVIAQLELISVLAAHQLIEHGTALTDSKFAEVLVPRRTLTPNMLRPGDFSPTNAVIAATDLMPGDILRYQDFEDPVTLKRVIGKFLKQHS